jgi:predicted ATPase
MIRELRLKNFKAFKDLELELRPFTLLSGLNSVGKSSILQSLLVLRQSYLESDGSTPEFPLQLNGEYVELGNVEDVFYRTRGRETTDNFLEIGITDDITGENTWQYTRPRSADFFDMPVFEGNESILTDSALFSTVGGFQYIQAERLGPRVYTQTNDSKIAKRDLGKAGEYTIHFLDKNQEVRIEHTPLLFDGTDGDNLLIDQVIKWMATISPNTKIVTQMDRSLGVSRLVIDGNRATNVGFGISYALPVIVAILSSTPADILLLENPEAHLHPQGQARMGELMARAASIGIQIICETHSDHILNGIRLGAKQGLISPEDVALQFFHKSESGEVGPVMPQVNGDGRLDYWPPGFFDQWGKSLDSLLEGRE